MLPGGTYVLGREKGVFPIYDSHVYLGAAIVIPAGGFAGVISPKPVIRNLVDFVPRVCLVVSGDLVWLSKFKARTGATGIEWAEARMPLNIYKSEDSLHNKGLLRYFSSAQAEKPCANLLSVIGLYLYKLIDIFWIPVWHQNCGSWPHQCQESLT